MQQLPEALAAMGAYAQFVPYRLVPSTTRPGKTDKKAVNRANGWTHSPVDPTIWSDFETARAYVATGAAHGVGFVFTDNDPFWFLDIDHAYSNGQWSPLSVALLAAVPGAAVEVSSSGEGLHAFGVGNVPEHGCDNKALQIGFYHTKRFVALTGTHARGNALWDGSAALPALISEYFPKKVVELQASNGWGGGPSEDWRGHTDDAELIRHACSAKSSASVFSGRASFADLWTANAEILSRAYPDDGDQQRPYGESEADAALAQHLAFWTGRDCDRILSLMWQSALVRDKWERDDYLVRTIEGAVGRCKNVHQMATHEQPESVEPGQAQPLKSTPSREVELTAGYQYLAPQQLVEYFGGCVYVRDDHKIFTPDGAMLTPERFKATYGGYTFVMDPEGRRTSRNAWEAFTENQAARFPKVSATMFRPDLEPGAVFEYEGRAVVNNYLEPAVEFKQGDPALFLDHLRRLLPDPGDRAITLAYMAACVQHKGEKFQWWPLYQGVEGNGKSLLSRCVAAAVGADHSFSPKAPEISNKFNTWIRDRVFIYVEDVYYSDGKREVIEALKPIVTNDWQPVEPKGVDVLMAYTVANGILNSNHRDAIRKTKNDRRFAVFYTAQQEKVDLARDGMDGDYFPILYNWLRKQGGYAIVADYLRTYPIPAELNPALDSGGQAHRAPETSTTAEVLAESLGGVEQEILEAIDEGRPGFAGGWVSSIHLARLLDDMRAGRAIPRNKRRDLMRELGYDYHPGLRDGRANSHLSTDGGKPRLFIRNGHIAANLTQPAEICRSYQAAQEGNFNPFDQQPKDQKL